MSIAIHHGPPGSYKTSGAIQDNFIPAAKAGRLVVTNIRGLDSIAQVKKVLPKIPHSFDLVNIDTTTEKGRFIMARWFHWLPKGAYLLIDEINTIYPTDYRDAALKEFDYPEGLDNAKEDDKPYTVKQAFEMHRHYNWDICVTTPHINKVHAIIRQCAEGAYRHKNQAMIGLKGIYLEIFHMADDNGKSASTHLGLRNRRIKKYVFELYSSTTTGEVKDTQAGRNIFLSFPVISFVFLFFCAFLYLFNTGIPSVFKTKEASVVSEQTNIPVVLPSDKNIVNTNRIVRNDKINIDSDNVDLLKGYKVSYVGKFGFLPFPQEFFSLEKDDEVITFSKKDLQKIGYKFKAITDCLFKVTLEQKSRFVMCATSASGSSGHSPVKPQDLLNNVGI